MRPVDKRNPNGPKEYGVIGIKDQTIQHDLAFTAENLESLYKMRPAKEASSVTLIIRKLGYDGNPIGHPYHIEKYEDFANRPFDELYDFISTPKYKLDRSHGDALEASHIK
jgi:hypothetical protein